MCDCHVVILNQLTLKLIAFGLKGYFQSWRNIFDVLLVIYSIIYIIFAIVILSIGPMELSNMPRLVCTTIMTTHCMIVLSHTTQQNGIILTALILAVLKAFTVLIKYVSHLLPSLLSSSFSHTEFNAQPAHYYSQYSNQGYSTNICGVHHSFLLLLCGCGFVQQCAVRRIHQL